MMTEVFTNTVAYSHGFYCRVGNRMHYKPKEPNYTHTPIGYEYKWDTLLIHHDAFRDLFGNKQISFSMEVVGWTKGVK